MMSDTRLLYETHSHTPLCNHAVGQPEEYAQAAFDRRLRGYTVTCHNPMPDGFGARVRMRQDEFPEYLAMVERARQAWLDRVDVRLGLECDYFPGYKSWLAEQVESAPFDYILGAVHPQLGEFRAAFYMGDPLQYQQAYFDQLAEAAETGFFDCLAHPDLVKNETDEEWRPAAVMDDICRALDRIAATDTAMELNTSGVNKTIPEMNPFPEMLLEMHRRAIPVVIGSDAHEPGRVGDGFIPALWLLSECGYTEVSYFVNRQRNEVSIDQALTSLTDTSPRHEQDAPSSPPAERISTGHETKTPWMLLETNYSVVKQQRYEVAVLPLGATEPHNLHLPYGTDVLEADLIGQRICAAAWERGARAVLLPTVPYGTETNMRQFPLAMNLNPSTLAAVVADLVESLVQSGVSKVVLLNSHGGNDMKPLLRELYGKSPAQLFLCNWYQTCRDVYSEIFEAPEDHAGEMETSLLLAYRPELVARNADGSLAADQGATRPMRFQALNAGWVSITRPWHLLTTNSGSGNPHAATAEKGEQLLEILVDRLATFLVELSAADVDDSFPF